MPGKHLYTLLNGGNVLCSMVVHHFVIRISLAIHFHSARNISVDDEYVWEK
jgi:hypothetical protein